MNCQVVMTATAKEDLRDIARSIARQAQDPAPAIRFVGELREQCRRLGQLPERGAVPRDRVLLSAGYRFLVYKDYLIFYRYEKEENTVYILSVLNGRRDYLSVLKKNL